MRPRPSTIIFLLALAVGSWLTFLRPEPTGYVESTVSLVVSLALLVIGADAMVHGAVRLARRLGVSPFFIGVTVVAFGTSAPELAASVGAAVKDAGELAIGNVMGSNIANICLILGVTAMIRSIPIEKSIRRVDAPIMLGITALASLTMLDRLLIDDATIGRVDGVLLCLGLVGYVWFNAKSGRIAPEDIEHEVEIEMNEPATPGAPPPIVPALVQIAMGLAGLILGADLLVAGATAIATALNVSQAIIGLTIVAFGTSIPELVFSARAAMKDHPEIAIGNIIGSNVFNLLSVLGVAALVRPIDIPASAAQRDVWVVLAVTAACVLVMKSSARVSRGEGIALLAVYVGYVAFVYAT